MNRVHRVALVGATLLVTLRAAPSWAGAPPNPTMSDDIADNTAGGTGALASNTTGLLNTAFGASALSGNTGGNDNTAAGADALEFNTTGNDNTASSSGERQYGLVAEEVAKVYPELVVRSGTGEVQSVKYKELIPMLLNQIQRQQSQLDTQAARLERLEEAARTTRVASR